MKPTRLFVEKKPGYRLEADHLKQTINDVLKIDTKTCRHILVYDVYQCDENTLELAKQSVFQEQVIDTLSLTLDTDGYSVIAYEALDGQYDQRSDSAMQCIKLLNPHTQVIVKSGIVVLVDAMDQHQLNTIKSYLINPVEMKEKDLSVMNLTKNVDVKPLESLSGFIAMDEPKLHDFYNDFGFAMTFDDLKYIQDHFKSCDRDPSETEIKVLDTYWSDHCRHTTFNTSLETITFEDFDLKDAIEASFNAYVEDRIKLNRAHKPLTLMDIATVNARLAKHEGDTTIEESDEVNACSIIIDVDHKGANEKWLLMFKNETHNHPTEIEPYGGASTCIGGAIRDPLSGRAYVYQAMRISGCGDVLDPIEKTLPNKLPQSLIAKRATDGYSSYGNQIGLTTTYVHEIYHPSYVAKHLECGAVVGAVKQSDVIRFEPTPGDVVILLGGKTGRDGIGGATGSSVAHKESSLTQSAAEVQKGNALEERKIQRLFRDPEVTKIIKRCNDFGAGGVSVAIGELADGLDIQLDQVRLKYEGLNPTEIAISESQERMAVVVSHTDADAFIQKASMENLEAYIVATVTNTNRLIMRYYGEEVVNLDRDFLNSSGVTQRKPVHIAPKQKPNPFGPLCKLEKQSLLDLAGSLNYGSQKGLIERFDGSIGATTVLMPLAGKYQTTQNCASVQKIPVLDGQTRTCSMLSYGFIPEISDYSPYLGGQYAIVESVAKSVAQGGDPSKIYLSLQEYFAKPGDDPQKWGNVFQALLGAYEAQSGLGLCAIGGKDSMSGTYQDLDVVDTLISFACSPQQVDTIISSALKKTNSYLYLVPASTHDNHTVDFKAQGETFKTVHELIKAQTILSCSSVDRGNVFIQVLNMALGNRVGVTLNAKEHMLLNRLSGSLIVESKSPLDIQSWVLIGTTQDSQDFIINDLTLSLDELQEAHLGALDALYPVHRKTYDHESLFHPVSTQDTYKPNTPTQDVHVVIPVFPGNNCEYDMARAFNEQGASTEFVIFRNQSETAIQKSIEALEQAIKRSHIIAIPGGFSSGDEPDGSAKFIVNVLKNERIKKAITQHLDQKRLIIGICNGFQALIKSGLIPYGNIRDVQEDGITLFRNDCQHHVSKLVNTCVSSNKSPWLKDCGLGSIHTLPISHGEGKITGNPEVIKSCIDQGLVAFQYCDLNATVRMDEAYNPNGSQYAIEGMVSHCGLVLGKMAHSERVSTHTFVDQDIEAQSIFSNGVNYFKEEQA